MGGVGGQVAQVEGLIHDALAGERSVSVQEDGHHLGEGKPPRSAAGTAAGTASRIGAMSYPHESSASQKEQGAACQDI